MNIDIEEDKPLIRRLSVDQFPNNMVPSRKNSYNPDTADKLQKLQKIRKMPFIKRNCRKIQNGSLRGAIITWVRLSMGIGVFAVPFFMKKMGVTAGVLSVILAGLINYKTFIYIFQAAEYSNKTTFPDIVKNILGQKVFNVFKFTMFFEYLSVCLLYTLASWNLFQYFGYYSGFFKEEWLVDKQTLEFDESNINVMLYRLGFFISLYLISVKFLLLETMESMRFISTCFVFIIFAMIFFLIFQSPFNYQYYKSKNLLDVTLGMKPLSLDWIGSFFAILLTFNIQVLSMDIRKELFHPTFRRITKVTQHSLAYEIIGGVLLSICGYMSLGDRFTPSLLILRKPIDPHSYIEIIQKVLNFGFFVCCIFGTPIFNIPIRRFILQMSGYDQVSKRTYHIVSLLPLFFICCIGFGFPYITQILSLFGLTIYNANAYLIPLLLKFKIEKNKGNKKQYFYLICFIMMASVSFIGTVNHFINNQLNFNFIQLSILWWTIFFMKSVFKYLNYFNYYYFFYF